MPSLRCQHGHAWTPTDPEGGDHPSLHGRCPECGAWVDPPTSVLVTDPVDSPWNLVRTLGLAIAGVLLPILMPLHPDWGVLLFGGGVTLAGGWVVITSLRAGMRKTRQYRALASYGPYGYRARIPTKHLWELDFAWLDPETLVRWEDELFGVFAGVRFTLFNALRRPESWRPQGQEPIDQTVVIFLDPLEGLADLELHPHVPTRARGGMELFTRWFGRRSPRASEEVPWLKQYRLRSADPTLAARLPTEFFHMLEHCPGWWIEAVQGRLLLTMPGRVFPPEMLGTVLAVCWQLRAAMATPVPEALA